MLGASAQGFEGGYGDALEFALRLQDLQHHLPVDIRIVTMQVNDVIEVSRALALGKCAQLFGEHLLEAIAKYLNAVVGFVRIGMMQDRKSVV